MEVVTHHPGDDASEVHRFRYAVYSQEMGWDTSEADHDRQLLTDRLDDYGVNYSLVDDGEIVGTVRVVCAADAPDLSLLRRTGMEAGVARFGPEAVAATSRFMLAPRVRGGTALLRLVKAGHQALRQRGVRLNYGTSSPHLLPFYEHMGFRRFGSPFNDPDYGWKFPIVLLVGDGARLRQIGSPLARLAKGHRQDDEACRWFAETYPESLGEWSAKLIDPEVFYRRVSEAVGHVGDADLLGALDRGDLEGLFQGGTLVIAEAGQRIIRQGETEDSLFVLLSGDVDVDVDGETVASLGAGSLIGEAAFLGDGVRSATVTANSRSQLLALGGEATRRFLRRNETAAALVVDELTRLVGSR